MLFLVITLYFYFALNTEYKNLVLRYSLAKKESAVYLFEMDKLNRKIERELAHSSSEGEQGENKFVEIINVATEKFEAAIGSISDVKVSDIKGIFKKFKNSEKKQKKQKSEYDVGYQIVMVLESFRVTDTHPAQRLL